MNDAEALRAALEHVMRVANESRTQTLRLNWIVRRCRSALAGDDEWQKAPKPRAESLTKQIARLRARLELLEAQHDDRD